MANNPNRNKLLREFEREAPETEQERAQREAEGEKRLAEFKRMRAKEDAYHAALTAFSPEEIAIYARIRFATEWARSNAERIMDWDERQNTAYWDRAHKTNPHRDAKNPWTPK